MDVDEIKEKGLDIKENANVYHMVEKERKAVAKARRVAAKALQFAKAKAVTLSPRLAGTSTRLSILPTPLMSPHSSRPRAAAHS